MSDSATTALSAASYLLLHGEEVPIVGQLFVLTGTLLDLVKEKKVTDAKMKAIHKYLERIGPILALLIGAAVGDAICDCLDDLYEQVEKVTDHVRKWLSQGGLLKLAKSYKFSAKFDEDIKNLKDGINLLNAAIAADTNLAVREGFREQEIQVEAIGARLTKHEKRVAAVLDRRDIV
ncbi:hypothetical protein TeGR_g6149, partial [Tetraparma gracilis]